MNFANENSLILLLALLPLIIIPFFKIYKSRKEAGVYFSDEAFRKFFRGYSFGKTGFKALLLCVALFCCTFSISSPYAGSTLIAVSAAKTDVIIAVDTSLSMNCEDVLPNRFSAQLREIHSVLEHKNMRVSLMPFSSSTIMLSPFTEDREALKMFMMSLKTGFIKNTGTDYEALFTRIISEIDNLERVRRKNGVEIIPPRIVLIFTDGESQRYPDADLIEAVKSRGIEVWIEVVATEKGGKIPVYDEDNSFLGYYETDYVSKPDIDKLREIVTRIAGRLFMYSGKSKMSAAFGEYMETSDKKGAASNTYEIRNDISFVFILIAVLALMISIII